MEASSARLTIPAAIRILAYDVRVKRITKAIALELGRNGDYDQFDQIIRIRRGMDDMRVLETLRHEIDHCIWYQMGLQDGDDEERIINALNIGRLCVRRDNPALAGWV